MRIAITGGSGFLGREIVSMINESKEHTPVILGRSSNNAADNYITVDYSKESLSNALEGIDGVIHLAAVREVGEDISKFQDNISITKNIFDSCVKHGIRNIVYASSKSVYSDVSQIPWTESQLPHPLNLYGISKLDGEYLSQIYHRTHGLNVKCLRISQIFGADEFKGHMMDMFINNAFLKKALKVKGKSIAKREYIYVKDVAAAILLAINKPSIHDIINIGSGETYTNYEYAKIVNRIFNNEGNLSYDDSMADTVMSSLMDSSKAFEVLGYKKTWSIEDGLKDIFKIITNKK